MLRGVYLLRTPGTCEGWISGERRVSLKAEWGCRFQKESSEDFRCQKKCLIIRQGRPEKVDGLSQEVWDNGREPRGAVKSLAVEAGKGGLGNFRGTFCHLGAGYVACCMALRNFWYSFISMVPCFRKTCSDSGAGHNEGTPLSHHSGSEIHTGQSVSQTWKVLISTMLIFRNGVKPGQADFLFHGENMSGTKITQRPVELEADRNSKNCTCAPGSCFLVR